MERMEKKRLLQGVLSALLLLLAAACVIVPFSALFIGDGTYAWQFGDPATAKMMAEIALLFVLIGASLLCLRRPALRWGAAAFVCLLFIYVHVVFLPMLVSALYLGGVLLAGRFLRTKLFRQEEMESGWMADFILGCSAVLSVFCLMSALRVGAIWQLRLFSLAAGGFLFLWAAADWKGRRRRGRGRRETAGWEKRPAQETAWEAAVREKRSARETAGWKKPPAGKAKPAGRDVFFYAASAFVIVMLLIQAGRMNISLDFDTLWYGVRSEYVLDNGSGIYENPGMVGMAYAYSKGLETLVLPLSDLASHSYLLFFNLWVSVLGLLGAYRLARLYMDRRYALMAPVCLSCIPGIMNMAISAKPDVITWTLQIFMVYYMALYIRQRGSLAAGRKRGAAGGKRLSGKDGGTVGGKRLPTGREGIAGRRRPAAAAQDAAGAKRLSVKEKGVFAAEGEERREHTEFALLAISGGAYLLSLTMKSTSLVFSTAVFGMSGLYLIAKRLLRLRAPIREWLLMAFPAAALTGIWARTMLITGMPVTSVFTSIFEKLGLQMKYPFASSALPQNWEEASNAEVLLRRLYHMLILPTGDDMAHVVFAWGSPLLLFLAGVSLAGAALLFCRGLLRRRRGTESRLETPGPAPSKRRAGQEAPEPGRLAEREAPEPGCRNKAGKAGGGTQGRAACGGNGKSLLDGYAHTVFWPFLAVNLVSLVMLYQVDGNYFMLLYTGLILGVLCILSGLRRRGFGTLSRAALRLTLPILAFNVLMTAESNWAWSLGFSEIRWVNNGRVNHEALQREKLVQAGNEQIWNILAEDSATRVIAFGDHPGCLQFPCVVQSYKDITSPWGNVELVNTVEAFEEYMAYAGADYAYVEAGFIGEGSWEWSYGLVRRMIERGTLTDLRFENGNVLARVDLDGQESGQSAENLRLFDENYITYEMRQGEP